MRGERDEQKKLTKKHGRREEIFTLTNENNFGTVVNVFEKKVNHSIATLHTSTRPLNLPELDAKKGPRLKGQFSTFYENPLEFILLHTLHCFSALNSLSEIKKRWFSFNLHCLLLDAHPSTPNLHYFRTIVVWRSVYASNVATRIAKSTPTRTFNLHVEDELGVGVGVGAGASLILYFHTQSVTVVVALSSVNT